MGFMPRAPKIDPPPPPVTSTGRDGAYAQEEARRRQAGREGYQSTLLASVPPLTDQKRTLLGG